VTEVGRPWDISYGSSGDGRISGTIMHEDGHVEMFTVQDEEELRAFLGRRERELAEEYGLRSRALIGKVLLVGGLASVIVGTVALLCAAFGSLAARPVRRAEPLCGCAACSAAVPPRPFPKWQMGALRPGPHDDGGGDG
jgi:hypothetical protein